MVWIVLKANVTTVDGLFMSLILLTLSGILFLNAYPGNSREIQEIRSAAGAENELTWSLRAELLPAAGRPGLKRSDAARLYAVVAGNCPLLPPAFARGRRDRLATACSGWSSAPALALRFDAGNAPGQQHYLDYFYPGALIMIVLFTSIFAMMSVIEDRKEGFLLSVMVAPVPRSAIVLGKVLGRNNAVRHSRPHLSGLRTVCRRALWA